MKSWSRDFINAWLCIIRRAFECNRINIIKIWIDSITVLNDQYSCGSNQIIDYLKWSWKKVFLNIAFSPGCGCDDGPTDRYRVAHFESKQLQTDLGKQLQLGQVPGKIQWILEFFKPNKIRRAVEEIIILIPEIRIRICRSLIYGLSPNFNDDPKIYIFIYIASRQILNIVLLVINLSFIFIRMSSSFINFKNFLVKLFYYFILFLFKRRIIERHKSL